MTSSKSSIIKQSELERRRFELDKSTVLNPQARGSIPQHVSGSRNYNSAAYYNDYAENSGNVQRCVSRRVLDAENQHTVLRTAEYGISGNSNVGLNPCPQFRVNAATGSNVNIPVASESNSNAVLNAYLERQGRNEYINLATQVGYVGANIAFVFFENQVRRLMNQSPYDERKLEVLRAACVGQPREMVNLFCAPLKSMTTAQRIEKALDRLRQRYGVSSGLTSEPKVIAIGQGAKVNFTASSLKMYNEDLNTLVVFAYAHDEYNKLSGQLLLDTANRLPNALKRRYLDFLDKNGISLNQPSFESLRIFVVHEINVTTSDYAQAFFKSEDKEKSREPQSGRSEFRVRQVALDSGLGAHNGNDSPGSAAAGGRGAPTDHNRGTKKANGRRPICFVCARADNRHYLVECEKFMKLPPQERRQTMIKAGRCLNCLSTEHLARNCPSRCKCRKCGPNCRAKHSRAIHDSYESQTVGAAGETKAAPGSPVASSVASTPTNNVKNVLKVRVAEEGTVLLRTSAVRVINQTTVARHWRMLSMTLPRKRHSFRTR